MTEEHVLPQDESAKNQGPPIREIRIKLATENGGLKSCPASFSDDVYRDWETIKSDNYFELLYLDYRSYDCITHEMIGGNFRIIDKFWEDISAKAMSSRPVANKYGGMDSVRRYPQILQKAYTELTSDANAPKKCFDQIIKNKQESLRPLIENVLMQGEYTPPIRTDMTKRGMAVGLTEAEISSLLVDILKEKNFEPERRDTDDPLSVKWYSEAVRKEKTEADVERLKKELDSIIEGVLADGEFEPRELSAVKDKGKQIGWSEEQVLSYFEQKLLAKKFSPDPDASIKDTNTIYDKLAVIWRTNEKHLEISREQFYSYLVGKLNKGIYTPDDHASITEASTGLLRRDAVKLKATLIAYLKGNKFEPVGKFQPGNELAVIWKTDWAKADPKPGKLKWIVIAILLIVGIVGYFSLQKNVVTPVDDPPNKKTLPEPFTKKDGQRETARMLASEALRQGTDLSVTISKLPKLEKVLQAALDLQEISPRYQDQVTAAKNTISATHKVRDKSLMAYLGKIIELGRYTPEQVSYAIDIIKNGEPTSREKIVVELLAEHIKALRKSGKPDSAKMLSSFTQRFSNFVD